MPRRRISPFVLVTVLATWLGVLLMLGVTAACIFPAMKHLDPFLPIALPRGLEPWKAAAGSIMTPLFRAAALAGVTIIPLGVVLAWFIGRPKTHRPRGAWQACGAAIGAYLAAAVAVAFIASRMGTIWSLLMQAPPSESVAPAALVSEMQRLHPWSTAALGVQVLALLAAIITAIIHARRLDDVQ